MGSFETLRPKPKMLLYVLVYYGREGWEFSFMVGEGCINSMGIYYQ